MVPLSAASSEKGTLPPVREKEGGLMPWKGEDPDRRFESILTRLCFGDPRLVLMEVVAVESFESVGGLDMAFRGGIATGVEAADGRVKEGTVGLAELGTVFN